MTDRELSILERARDELQLSLKEVGGCDHSVGVCCCDLIRLVEDLDEVIAENKLRSIKNDAERMHKLREHYKSLQAQRLGLKPEDFE